MKNLKQIKKDQSLAKIKKTDMNKVKGGIIIDLDFV